MLRYNIFNQAHKGLRIMLYETAKAIQLCDFSNTEEAETALGKLDSVLNLFEKHAATEDNLVLPKLIAHDPAVVNVFESEHEEDLALTRQLQGLVAELELALNFESKIKAGIAINNAFVHFMTFNLQHMAKEEEVLNKLLWKHYSDLELILLTEEIVKKQQPAVLEIMTRWMMRGLNNMEIVNWLKNVKNNAPEFAFQSLICMAEQEVESNRWQLIQEQLTEGALIA